MVQAETEEKAAAKALYEARAMDIRDEKQIHAAAKLEKNLEGVIHQQEEKERLLSKRADAAVSLLRIKSNAEEEYKEAYVHDKRAAWKEVRSSEEGEEEAQQRLA
eukprot:CAMPEP_0177741042 /NCGR_PEP_ID=MMETSP0484_2-20121128/27898_1 /TAXON_ID=354590 /ORGANISM="Rhodomonas lens, Strain RHODO" /LENGTH=104 /DNA_ID=CAMNT_0019255245 /DNA_START=36 /DNA_END=346 /DNA_ORIENTATION=-